MITKENTLMIMEYRTLGRTGLKVSVVGLGSLGFMRADSSDEDVARMLGRAAEGGINFLDTAYAYGKGKTDTMVGKAIEKDRDRWVILGRSHMRDPKEFAETSDQTFKNLRTDVIDLFELHDITNPRDYEATKQAGGIYDVALQMKKDGRIRFVGISTHATAEIVRDMIESDRYDVITISYNVANRGRSPSDGESMARTEEELLPLAESRGMGITIMKPYGGGSLVQARPGPDGKPVTLSPLQLLKFCVANPYVDCVTPGVDSVAQVEVAIEAGQEGAGLTAGQIEELKKLTASWGTDFCRRCGYCLPCGEGIAIPSAM
ncbi:MAG: aldo/keto reductase [Planctomycetes bacterium]|nr:aldo/keto reductase [Planctomycetota bacterium]